MKVSELQEKILKLKKETNTVILAHNYQSREIVEIADFTGDSYKLCVDVMCIDAENILFCGVNFMAETAKILSPQKNVFISNKSASCPMAEQIDKDIIVNIRDSDPDRTIVTYINTTANLKTVCDVCVTSSSAIDIINRLDSDKILFIPDYNLGNWIKKQIPDKDIMLLHGGCQTHMIATISDVMTAKSEHPDALFLAHPECINTVTDLADYVGSTSGIMNFAKKSNNKEFIIGTENSIIEHLQYDCPDKKFYMLTKNLVCLDMKINTLHNVYNTLRGITGDQNYDAFEICMDDELRIKAKKCLDKMIELL